LLSASCAPWFLFGIVPSQKGPFSSRFLKATRQICRVQYWWNCCRKPAWLHEYTPLVYAIGTIHLLGQLATNCGVFLSMTNRLGDVQKEGEQRPGVASSFAANSDRHPGLASSHPLSSLGCRFLSLAYLVVSASSREHLAWAARLGYTIQ
jgi:hypothetical protein